MSQADGSIIIDTRIDEAGFSKGLNMMKTAAVAGIAAITAAIGTASVAVMKLGSEFEQANAKASTLFGDAQVDMTQYQGKMLELSTKTGLAASELGNTMYDALSAGIPASDDMSEALGFLEKNTKLAKAGFTDVNTATTATAKVLNAYKMDVSETDRIHKVLMQTQNKGITTVNELGSVLSQVTPTASAMGVSFEQVGAALAGMTAQGTPTAQATTQLNQLIAELGKNGTQANKAMMDMYEGMGYGKKSFKELMDEGVTLVDIIVDMEGYAKENDKSLIDMFGSLEAGKAALSMAGDNAITFTNNLEAMKTKTDVVGEAYDKVTDTFKEKSAKVVNSLKNVGIAAYSKFEKPLKKSMDVAQGSVDELSKQMSNGKLGKSVDKIAEAFGKLIEVAAKLAEKAIPLLVNGFSFLIDHGKELTIALSAVGGAMLAMKTYNTAKDVIEPLMRSFQQAALQVKLFEIANTGVTVSQAALNGTLSLGETAVALLTGKISLATAAQSALNAVQAVSPMGWVAIGVGALTAGLTALCLMTNDVADENEELRESLEKSNEEWEKLKNTQEEKLATDLGMIQNTEKLKNELDTLVDANGKVKKGYEDRASFILGELNDALGTEYSMTDGVINNYKEMTSSIDELITKKRVKAILDAQEPIYQKAITEQQKEGIQIAKLQAEVTDKNNRMKAIENDLIKKYGDNWAIEAGRAQDAMLQEYGTLAKSTSDKKKVLNDYQKSYDKHTEEIINYENNATLAASKNKDDWVKVQTDIQAESGRTYEEKKKNLELEVSALDMAYKDLIQRQEAGDKRISDAQIEAAKKSKENKEKELRGIQSTVEEKTPGLIDVAKNLANKSVEAMNKVKESKSKGADNAAGYGKGIDSKTGAAKTSGGRLASASASGSSNYSGMKSVGQESAQGYIDGLASMAVDAFNAGFSFVQSAMAGGRKGQDSHSPSRKWKREIGITAGQGYILGLEAKSKDAEKTATDFVRRAIDAANEESERGIDISSIVSKARQAVYAEQSKMAAVADIQSKTEILKTSMFKTDLSAMSATMKGVIENRIYIGDRETAHVLAPFISEEMAFQGR